jgi:hypothetical protein
MFRAEQSNVRRRQTAATFREWNVVIEVKILHRTTLDALATIASPDFDFHRRWYQSIVRKLNEATK